MNAVTGNKIPVQEGPRLRGGTRVVVGYVDARSLAEGSVIPRRDFRQQEGYQREASSARVNRLMSELARGQVDLPTSVLFNIRDFTDDEHLSQVGDQLFLSLRDAKLWIVDGQHRVEALKGLVRDDPEVWDSFQIPFVSMLGADETTEMEQFYVVNSTAKSVRTDLALDLLKQRAEADPRVMQGLIESGQSWKVKAQTLAEKLDELSSPWAGRIRFPGEPKAATTISSSGVVSSLRPALRDEWFDAITVEDQVKILTSYWQALRRILQEAFDEPARYTVQKTIGAYVLNGLLMNAVNVLRSKGMSVLDVDSFVSVLEDPLSQLQGDNGLGDVVQGIDFWKSGVGGAAGSFTSNAGRRVLQAKLKAALPPVEVG